MGREWQGVGRGGSTRPRDISRSLQDGWGTPGKKVNKMASPNSISNSSPISITPNMYRMPVRKGMVNLDEDGEGRDDAEMVY